VEELSGVFSAADTPGTLIVPRVLGQAPKGPAALCIWVEQRGALQGTAFAQRPQLLCSPTPKLKSKPKVLLKPAHLACAPARALGEMHGNKFLQLRQGQRQSQRCWGLPPWQPPSQED